MVEKKASFFLSTLRGFIKKGGRDFPLQKFYSGMFSLIILINLHTRVYRQILSNHPLLCNDGKKVNETPALLSKGLLNCSGPALKISCPKHRQGWRNLTAVPVSRKLGCEK